MVLPSINANAAQTLASMQRLAEVLEREHAQLWINHAKAQRDRLKLAPRSMTSRGHEMPGARMAAAR
jgi:hypothetical protein